MPKRIAKTELEYYQEHQQLALALTVAMVQGEAALFTQLEALALQLLEEISVRFNVFLPSSPDAVTPPGKIHLTDWFKQMALRKQN